MELPPQDFQANIVDYYENMRDTHWNPRFGQLSLDLAGRLLSVRASFTGHSVDRWPEAQLTLLTSPDRGHSAALATSATTNSQCPASGSHLATCYLLKHLLANSVPVEAVLQTTATTTTVDVPRLESWPQVQQYFSKLRSLIFISGRPATQPPLPLSASPPPPLPPSGLFNLLPFPPSSALPLLLLAQPSPYLLPAASMPLLTTPTPTPTPTPPPATPPSLPLTGNLLASILALTTPSAAPMALRLPSLATQLGFPQTPLQQIAPSMLSALVPPQPPSLANGQQALRMCCSHLQVVCFKDEAKTRFMCAKCSKQWTSMKGAITFVVIMSHQTIPTTEVVTGVEGPRPGLGPGPAAGAGQLRVTLQPGANVLLELFPQACADCALRGEVQLSPPKWYPEEVDKVLRNLFVNIHRTFYKNVIFWEQQFDRRRRPGHPTGRHDNTKCLACLNGMCVNAIGQSANQLMVEYEGSADRGSQSERSPACKRRLVPSSNDD